MAVRYCSVSTASASSRTDRAARSRCGMRSGSPRRWSSTTWSTRSATPSLRAPDRTLGSPAWTGRCTRGQSRDCTQREGDIVALTMTSQKPMHTTGRVDIDGAVDADGHILEPPTLWEDYIDPAFRDR